MGSKSDLHKREWSIFLNSSLRPVIIMREGRKKSNERMLFEGSIFHLFLYFFIFLLRFVFYIFIFTFNFHLTIFRVREKPGVWFVIAVVFSLNFLWIKKKKKCRYEVLWFVLLKITIEQKSRTFRKVWNQSVLFLSKTVHVVQPAAQCNREMSAAVCAGVGVGGKHRANISELKTILGRCCKWFIELKHAKFYLKSSAYTDPVFDQ